MAKPKNKTIGHCACRVSGCTEKADIRRRKDHERGARYLDCPVHGVQGAFGKQQQFLDEWIDSNTISPETKPEPEPEPEPAQVPEISETIPEPITDRNPVKTPEPAETVPEKKPKKRAGFFSGVDKDLDSLMA